MGKKYLVTAALPYVNGVPHLGHIVATHLPADICSRYLRMKYGKNNVLFIGGTDENGTTTEILALKEKKEPLELATFYFNVHRKVYQWFNISYDFFGRTSLPIHHKVTQELFLGLFKAGFIKEVEEKLFYCKNCRRFLADRYIEGICPKCNFEKARGDQCDKCGSLLTPNDLISPYCSICKSKDLEIKKVYNLSLNLPKLKAEIRKFLDKAVLTELSKSWSLSLLENIKERTITRDIKFGVKIPKEEMENILISEIENKNLEDATRIIENYGLLVDEKRKESISSFLSGKSPELNLLEEYEDKVFYVWFDAPIGYLTFTICKCDLERYSLDNLYEANTEILVENIKKEENWKKWFANAEVKLIHFVGKDNIPFHTIVWPSMLIGFNKSDKKDLEILDTNLILPYSVMGFHYLTHEGKKISKSRNWGVFCDKLIEIGLHSDYWRFYLTFLIPENRDKDFLWKEMEEKINKDLVGNLSNFIYRVLVFISKFEEVELKTEISEIIKKREEIIDRYAEHMDNFRFREALEDILRLTDFGNKEFQNYEPWKKIKEENKIEDVKNFLANLFQIVHSLPYLLNPFLPGKARELADMIGIELKEDEDLHLAKSIRRKILIKKERLKHLFENVDINNLSSYFKPK